LMAATQGVRCRNELAIRFKPDVPSAQTSNSRR
jgi:hypothetical protein